MAADWVAAAVFLLGALLALASAPLALAEAAEDATRDRVQRAFDRTFQQPGVRRIELRVARAGREVARRRFELAHRREGWGARSLLRFVAPDYLRGHALLIVDAGAGQPPDTWLYQPEERRPRRVGVTQKGDAFYGSDLSYEDLERADWRRWRVATVESAEEGGVACLVLDAWPPAGSQYGRLRVWLATQLEGVARIDFFGRAGARPEAGEPPFKRLRVPLGGVEAEQGYLRVRRIEVEAVGRDARTELVVERLVIDPAIAASLFSAVRLEREGQGLFELAEQHERDAAP
ncbi:MAG TPA: outer membrane lipoprotein-sorting protein [Myxococcota bacterium]|nr:outer membrane lipoprotein-sorting protein [Myxococcota bacterium]